MPDQMVSQPIVTRKEAKERGLKRYFTGGACPDGHVAERITINGRCIECSRAGARKYHDQNPDKVKAITNAWRAENRQAIREYDAAWTEANPSKARARRQNERARAAGVSGVCSGEDIDRMHVEQGGRCNACMAPFDVVEHTVDHIAPLSSGGSNEPNNLQLLCFWCNRSKRNKDFRAWLLANKKTLDQKKAHWAEWCAARDAAF